MTQVQDKQKSLLRKGVHQSQLEKLDAWHRSFPFASTFLSLRKLFPCQLLSLIDNDVLNLCFPDIHLHI